MIVVEAVVGAGVLRPYGSGATGASRRDPFVGGETRREAPVVHIVDLDEDARVLSGWLGDIGVGSQNYAVLGDFMDADPGDMPGCLVIDADIARRAHPDLGAFLRRLGELRPVVITACDADVPTAVLAIKTGAIDFVEKPYRERDILQAIDAAIAVDQARRATAARQAGLGARYATLSRREREVMALVTAGKLNKQAAGDLGLSEITVKAHRGAVMRKMGARSLAELVRMADAIDDAGA